MPVRPMLATLSKEPVVGPDWVLEEKYDGIRAVAQKKKERVKLWSRTGQDPRVRPVNVVFDVPRSKQTMRSPFDPAPRTRDATWVSPDLVAQLAYQEWTADGNLRPPAFLGLRTDKKPKEVAWQAREP